jgi:hypothetical protein
MYYDQKERMEHIRFVHEILFTNAPNPMIFCEMGSNLIPLDTLSSGIAYVSDDCDVIFTVTGCRFS